LLLFLTSYFVLAPRRPTALLVGRLLPCSPQMTSHAFSDRDEHNQEAGETAFLRLRRRLQMSRLTGSQSRKLS